MPWRWFITCIGIGIARKNRFSPWTGTTRQTPCLPGWLCDAHAKIAIWKWKWKWKWKSSCKWTARSNGKDSVVVWVDILLHGAVIDAIDDWKAKEKMPKRASVDSPMPASLSSLLPSSSCLPACLTRAKLLYRDVCAVWSWQYANAAAAGASI